MTPEMLLAGQLSPTALAALVRAWNPPKPAYLMREELPRQQTLPEQRLDLVRFELLPADHKELAEFFSEDATPVLFASQTSGRIFCRQGELRWETGQADRPQVAFIGEETSGVSLPGAQAEYLSGRYQRRPEHMALLLGTRLDHKELQRIGPPAQEGDFAEVRIPRLLRYPSHMPPAERLQLTIAMITCKLWWTARWLRSIAGLPRPGRIFGPCPPSMICTKSGNGHRLRVSITFFLIEIGLTSIHWPA